MRTRHITRVKSNNTYIFAFFVFALFYVIQEKRQKILLKQSLILWSVCVIIVTRPIGDQFDDKRTK